MPALETAISVVVPTRDRPRDLARLLDSIARCDPAPDEVIVVDQSRADDAGGPPTTSSGTVVFVRSATVGAAHARNEGTALARGEVVLFTDDDCTVPVEWIAHVRRVMAEHPDADVVFGQVELVHPLAPDEYAAAFRGSGIRWAGELPPVGRDWGISAHMAVRRSALARFGRFDPLLGVGGRFGSAAETDFALRVLSGGGVVVEDDGVAVIHHGIRSGADVTPLFDRYAAGIGAALAKHRRLGRAPSTFGLRRFTTYFCSLAARNLITTGRPRGARFLIAMWRGVWRSTLVAADASTSLFVTPVHARRQRWTSVGEMIVPLSRRRSQRSRTEPSPLGGREAVHLPLGTGSPG